MKEQIQFFDICRAQFFMQTKRRTFFANFKHQRVCACLEELNTIQTLNHEHSGKWTVEQRSVDGAFSLLFVICLQWKCVELMCELSASV